MDEDLKKDIGKTEDQAGNAEDGIHHLTMDKRGKIYGNSVGIALSGKTKTYVILGWICAAFTAFLSIYFAIPGIVLGAVANRNVRGSGNIVIIANIIFAIIRLFLGFLFVALWRMLTGY